MTFSRKIQTEFVKHFLSSTELSVPQLYFGQKIKQKSLQGNTQNYDARKAGVDPFSPLEIDNEVFSIRPFSDLQATRIRNDR